ncbi:hypothetical protein EPA93_09355 [Ktedonosporobacter rubrisoli]|uniref:Uncharacterized protein n=1 Tax=Ktedonosporobacter rubrisoli TaxID=2509675 RepID=A0A4P6JNA4_KTERU|nr:hypothetical protein [Ktedonosporobacter rubrisoli]QBD76206.1 hypothetical protein EPA93_09355 [Ktedonosporobacter rubrisoli]
MSKEHETSRDNAEGQVRQTMPAQQGQQSELASLRAQIELELEAMQQGLNGLASGTARHRFISARMRRVDQLTSHMAGHIGEEQAERTSCQAYMQIFSAHEQEPKHGDH